MKIKHLKLNEAPIRDIEYVGDMSKGKSIRYKNDRMLITNKVAVDRLIKKFGNLDVDINLVFVNMKANNDVPVEVGEVNLNWIHERFGEEVYNTVNNLNLDDALTVIFTNNYGDQRKPLTPWIIAHRIMHALARYNMSSMGNIRRQFDQYTEIEKFIVDMTEALLDEYGVFHFTNPTDIMRNKNARKSQLIVKNLFQHLGTFRSARDKKIRDWFEVINELGAQFIIQGEIKFNNPPLQFQSNRDRYTLRDTSEENMRELRNLMDMYERDLTYLYDSLFMTTYNKIVVM